jgi:hypothetical protein
MPGLVTNQLLPENMQQSQQLPAGAVTVGACGCQGPAAQLMGDGIESAGVLCLMVIPHCMYAGHQYENSYPAPKKAARPQPSQVQKGMTGTACARTPPLFGRRCGRHDALQALL